MKKVSLLKLLTAILIIAVVFAAMPIQSLAAVGVGSDENASSVINLQSSLPENITFEEATARGHISRAYADEETLNSAAFVNGNGTRSMYVFNENIKYTTDDGQTKDKSTRLISILGGYTNPDNNIRVFYPNNIDNGVTLVYDEHTIVTKPVLNAEEASDYNASAELTVMDGNTITYPNVFGNHSALRYTQQLSGYKEEIILERKTGKTVFAFSVKTNGLVLQSKEGRVYLADPETEKEYAEISPVVMWDANEVYSSAEYSVEEVVYADKYVLTIDATEYLQSESTVYPVIIDPSLSIGQEVAGAFQDASIFTNYSSSFGGWFSLFVGNYNARFPSASQQRGLARTLVKFPGILTDANFRYMYSNDKLISVKYCFSDIDCTVNNRINAYMYKTDWSESTTYTSYRWSAYGDYIGGATVVSRTMTFPLPRYEIDITSAMKSWMKGSTNYGIMLRASDESLPSAMIGARESGQSGVGGRADSKPYAILNYKYDALDNTVFRIKNAKSKLYMTVAEGLNEDGTNVYQTAYLTEVSEQNSNLRQEFRLTFDSTANAYRIRTLSGGNGRYRVIDIKKSASGTAGLTAGCNVQIYRPVDDISQLYYFEQNSDGTYKIKLRSKTNMVLSSHDDEDAVIEHGGTSSTSPGNITLAESSLYDEYQNWILERAETNDKELYYSSMGLDYPFKGSSYPKAVTSCFGLRYHPIREENLPHAGVDIGAASGVPLYSAIDGVVKAIGFNRDGEGNYIIIEATDQQYKAYRKSSKISIVYMHMAESPTVTNPSIVVGATVHKGDLVGKAGASGRVTGSHLHFTIIDKANPTLPDANSLLYTIEPLMFYPEINFTF